MMLIMTMNMLIMYLMMLIMTMNMLIIFDDADNDNEYVDNI